ncbi:MAG TPA: trigger factor [Chitinophagaceae bacterium]|nr:trigger factor [Chitinophagaceae bacterium]
MPTVSRENISILNDKLTVTVNREDYLPSFEKQLKQFAKNANIPGFRKGMVPAGMVRKMHGPAIFADEVLRSIEKGLMDYLREEKLDIFAQPLPSAENSADQLNMNEPGDYSFSFEIGLKPDFKLDLGSFKMDKYKIEVTDAMIEEEVDRLRQRLGKMNEPETVTTEDNVLNVVFEESDASGQVAEGAGKKENSLLVKYFSPAFREKLMGLKKDDHVVLQLTSAFEEKEREWLIKDLGVDATDPAQLERFYKMTIAKVGLVEKRELNEEFFKEAFPAKEIKTEEEFRNTLKEEIAEQWNKQSTNYLHHELYHKLLDGVQMDFPELFLKRWMQTGGEQPKTAEQVEEEFPGFKNQLRWTLISDKIVRENNLDVSPDELRDYMRQQIMGYFGGMSTGGDMSWLESYVDRMMQDEQQLDTSYRRLITEKIFQWAEGQVKTNEKSVSSDDFIKMQDKHNHEHH